MKNVIKLRIAAAIITALSIYLFAPWQFALYYLTPLPETIQEQLDETVAQGVAGIIVYVHENDDTPELYASGWHDRINKIPAKSDALFKMASIAKLYVASAITKLVANDKLVLDKTLADYLPHLAKRIEHADKITIRMMVQHRSGIPNFTDHEDFDWSSSSLDLLSLVLDTKADFKPNEDYAYSNTNYLLLKKIMTEVLGYDYTIYIQNEILRPLTLNRTYFSVNDIKLTELMSGYYVGYEDDFKALDQGYIATAEDVGIFLKALNEKKLFTAKEQEIYTSIYEYDHTGWVLGYLSIARYHEETKTTIVQFINTNGDDTILLSEIVHERIVKILENRKNR